MLCCHTNRILAASFLASFGALGERKGASNAWWGSTNDQAAPERRVPAVPGATANNTDSQCRGQRLLQLIVRHGAFLSDHHVAVGASEVQRADANTLHARLAGQRASICPFYAACRPLGCQIVPKLAALFLTSFEAPGERKGTSYALWGSTKDQTAPEDARLLCRRYGRQRGFPMFWPAATTAYCTTRGLSLRPTCRCWSAGGAES